MKVLKFFVIGMMLLFAVELQAQVSADVKVGLPPAWGPAEYPSAHYYYLPDVEAFYDVQSAMFIYYDNGMWIHGPNLPKRFKNYDLYKGFKVVSTDYKGSNPNEYFREFRTKYPQGYQGPPQITIGVPPEVDHPQAIFPFKALPKPFNPFKDKPRVIMTF
jgi:hypothetical protein